MLREALFNVADTLDNLERKVSEASALSDEVEHKANTAVGELRYDLGVLKQQCQNAVTNCLDGIAALKVRLDTLEADQRKLRSEVDPTGNQAKVAQSVQQSAAHTDNQVRAMEQALRADLVSAGEHVDFVAGNLKRDLANARQEITEVRSAVNDLQSDFHGLLEDWSRFKRVMEGRRLV